MPKLPLTHDGRLASQRFVVVGEGLAAGMGSFSLSSDTQKYSFAAQLAAQMGVPFSQPLIQPPGIGQAIGFAAGSSIIPSALQSTVLEQMPPDPPGNLAVPGMTVSDSIRKHACPPLIHRNDNDQTVLNLLLAAREFHEGVKQSGLPTQLETAVNRKPALAVVELGYAEALNAATSGDLKQLPAKDSTFRKDYARIVRELREAGAQVVVLTIPNPLHSAFFSSVAQAAQIAKIDPALLIELWRIRRDNLITANGLNEMSCQIFAAATGEKGMAEIGPLPDGSILAAEFVTPFSTGLDALNREIAGVAIAEGAVLFDLHALFKSVKEQGVAAGTKSLTGSYLGGFYSLNGYYPGATGHALIANGILAAMNRNWGSQFPLVDLASVVAADPVADYRPAQGPNWTRASLASPPKLPAPSVNTKFSATGAAGGSLMQPRPSPANPLRLPPGLEQVLDLNPDASFFGDALTAQNCLQPETVPYGTGFNLIFGGFAMMDSHLSGRLKIKFTPPVDNWTNFTVTFEGGLRGSDSVLAAPSFFKMPGRQQYVTDVTGQISSGKLNLATGWLNSYDITSGAITLYGQFFNTALFSLLRVVPNFPKSPLSFPGQYGSAFARFDQRPDGRLDFTFSGSTFVPLGAGARFPLNFCGPSWEFSSIPAAGTILHPHISLTTRASAAPSMTDSAPGIPFNTTQEFTLVTAISSFGDQFTLDAPQLGGYATGRSRLLGRIQIQFGPRSGNSVPIAVLLAGSGGVLAPLNPTPLTQLFPGRMLPGPEGFGTTLRFPLRAYQLNDLGISDDTFDISVGALDVRTGELVHPLLHRAFISQDLLFALLRVEPRTPRASFYFRGPGSLKQGPRKESVFRCFTQCHLPYPPGFLFPDPNLATGFAVTGKALDPYIWMWAIQDRDNVALVRSAKADCILSGKGEQISYRFTISGNPALMKSEFVYTNHSQQASFTMHSLAWLGFGNSSTGGDGDCDMLTFSCFGVWKSLYGKDTNVQAAVQLLRSPKASWVGIQIARSEIGDADIPPPPDFFPIPALGPG